MFDNYRDSQFLAYSLILNSVKNNKVSHAYLIDGNNYFDLDNFVLSFVKLLICPYNYSNNNNCFNCNKCMRIDNNNYTEIKYIKPINNIIKKEQLSELQENFSLSSIEGKRKIYVIWNAELMNDYAANSILKFLEEPNDNIIAILVTSNLGAVLPTIISRCQCIKLLNFEFDSNDSDKKIKKIFTECGLNLDKVNYLELANTAVDFVSFFETHGLDTILFLKKIWYNNVVERDYYRFCFKIILYFYYDILKYKTGSNISFCLDYKDKVVEVANLIDIFDIIKRINVYIKFYELLNYNLNLNLLMDRLVIELGEVL